MVSYANSFLNSNLSAWCPVCTMVLQYMSELHVFLPQYIIHALTKIVGK